MIDRRILLAGLAAAPLAGCASMPAADARNELKLVTFNIWHNQGDWAARLPLLFAVIRAEAPDVIGLQEVLEDAAVGLPAARDLLAAHPDAKKIAVVGLNDGGVLALINAAEQLGRADEVIGWGQDGAFITGDNVNPHLVGSVFYFLEGYAVYAVRDVIKPVADGNTPPLKADAGDPASKVQPCPVTAEQAKSVPDMPERVAQLLAAPAGTTAYDLFCPNKG